MKKYTEKIDYILKNKNLSRSNVSTMVGCSRNALNQMIRGDISFSEKIEEKILPILEISKEEFESWIIADKYPKEIIEKAIKSFKTREDKKKSVLSQNINRILKEKNLSQTAFSKIIKHSQSSLNCAITGKEPLSKKLMGKISIGLELSQDDLQAWVLADKYSLKVLELALKAK